MHPDGQAAGGQGRSRSGSANRPAQQDPAHRTLAGAWAGWSYGHLAARDRPNTEASRCRNQGLGKRGVLGRGSIPCLARGDCSPRFGCAYLVKGDEDGIRIPARELHPEEWGECGNGARIADIPEGIGRGLKELVDHQSRNQGVDRLACPELPERLGDGFQFDLYCLGCGRTQWDGLQPAKKWLDCPLFPIASRQQRAARTPAEREILLAFV